MSSLTRLPVNKSSVQRNSVIPNHNSSLSPLDAGMEVGAPGDVLVQEVEDGVGLLLLEANDLAGDWIKLAKADSIVEIGPTLRVDEERLLTGHGVSSNNRVSVDDGLTTLDAALPYTGVDLLDARVSGIQAVKELLERRRQAVVRLGSVGEESVTTDLRDIEDVQEGGAWRLSLVGDIGVPCHRADTLLEEGLVGLVTGATMDEMNLGVASRGARGRVNVVSAKVATELESLVDGQVGKVLVAEGNDLALSNESSELVLASVGQAAQLDTGDLGADSRSKVSDLGGGSKEVREG